jgi:hypothetical protein
LMCSWAAPAPDAITEAQTQESWGEIDMQLLEDAVAHFYCQEFYDYFGQAPVIPTRLP